VNPLFFGDPEESLFGIYTPSRGIVGRKGAVLCPPIGQEALVSHRSLKILSERLADAGLDVLRFDYFGTGDSAGDNRSGGPERWRGDVRTAVDKLRELAGVRQVVLVGLRLGGLLAAAAQARSISQLVLWDPLLRGRDYITEIEPLANKDCGEWEVLGFPFSPRLRDELEQLDIAHVERLPRDVRIVITQEPAAVDRLRQGFAARNTRVEIEHVAGPPVWIEERALGLGALPVGILRQIVGWAQ
jgi:pimeloyl-ACP methyl ester carboxylesterase